MNIIKNIFFILIDLWLIIPLRYREWVEKKNPPLGRIYLLKITICYSKILALKFNVFFAKFSMPLAIIVFPSVA